MQRELHISKRDPFRAGSWRSRQAISVANLATALQESTITSITVRLGSISGMFLRNRFSHQYYEYEVLDHGLNVTAI